MSEIAMWNAERLCIVCICDCHVPPSQTCYLVYFVCLKCGNATEVRQQGLKGDFEVILKWFWGDIGAERRVEVTFHEAMSAEEPKLCLSYLKCVRSELCSMLLKQNVAWMQVFSATGGLLGPKWVKPGRIWVKCGWNVGHVGCPSHVYGSIGDVGPKGDVGHWASKFR